MTNILRDYQKCLLLILTLLFAVVGLTVSLSHAHADKHTSQTTPIEHDEPCESHCHWIFLGWELPGCTHQVQPSFCQTHCDTALADAPTATTEVEPITLPTHFAYPIILEPRFDGDSPPRGHDFHFATQSLSTVALRTTCGVLNI